MRHHRQYGVRSDGPGSAEQIVKGMGSVSMREHRDCFAYVLRNKPSPPSSRMRLVMDTDLNKSTPSELMNNMLCTGSKP